MEQYVANLSTTAVLLIAAGGALVASIIIGALTIIMDRQDTKDRANADLSDRVA